MLTQEISDDEIGTCMKSRQLSRMLMTLVVWKTIENRVTTINILVLQAGHP